LQQSVASWQELPAPLQTVTDDLHLLVTGSQTFEQHWPLLVHASSTTVHTTPVPPEPGAPSLPSVPWASVGVPDPALWVEHAFSPSPHNEKTITVRTFTLGIFVPPYPESEGSLDCSLACSAECDCAFMFTTEIFLKAHVHFPRAYAGTAHG
jgi:hypothetical protein